MTISISGIPTSASMVVTGTLFIQAGALLSFHLEGRALLFTSGTELITERPLSIGNGGEAGHSDPHNREPGPILMCSADLALPSTKSNTNPSAQNQARTLASPSKPKTRISVNRSWALFSFAANRTIELSSGSNPRGEFIKIQEKRREGKRFILLPSGPRNDDVNLFFKALSFFVEKVTNATTSTTSSLRRSTTPFTAPQVSDPPMKLLCDTPSVHPPPIHSQSTAVETETPGLQSQTGEGDLSEENPSLGRVEDRGLDLEASGNNPLNPGFNSNLARFYEVIRDDDNPKEADIHHKADMGKQIEPFQGLQPYTILYPPLQRSSLSPLATEFIPTTPNSFAVLFNPGHASETSLDPIPLEDPLVNLYERNMALYNNAIEDLPHERDEPLLYTHSDGEDKVFIDYKLKPLQIDTSRCSKTPLLLGRVFKGRKTYSPSQVVTRSKARLLAEGRKKSPLGWFEDPDEPANTFANEIIQAFKQSCPVKKEVTPKQPLTRSQKKKAKKKLKLAKVVEQNWDDYEDDYL